MRRLRAARAARQRQTVAWVLLAVASALSWKAIEAWSQMEQARIRADAQVQRAQETTKQMQLIYETARGGKLPSNMPPPPELRRTVPLAPAAPSSNKDIS